MHNKLCYLLIYVQYIMNLETDKNRIDGISVSGFQIYVDLQNKKDIFFIRVYIAKKCKSTM